MNRSKTPHRRGYPEIPGVISVPYCSCTGPCSCGWRTSGPGGNALADRLHPERGNLDPREIAFLILEPVQGEGGYRPPSNDFVADVADIRDRHDIAIIADEIQTGLGRTGEFWAIDHTPIQPDVVTAAKGLRVGATVSRADVFPDETDRLSSTWGAGDVTAALEGAMTLDVVRDEGLVANARDRGQQFRDHLEDVAPEAVIDVRGRGLMLGVEFDSKDCRDAVVDAAFDRGLLVLGCGDRTLRVLPPRDVTVREIDLGARLLCDAIAAVTRGSTA